MDLFWQYGSQIYTNITLLKHLFDIHFVFIDFHFPIFGQPLRQKTPRIQSTDIFNISLNLVVEKKNGQFSFF